VRGRGITAQDTAYVAAGGDCEPDICEEVFPQCRSDRAAFRHRSSGIFGAWEIVGVFRDFKMENPKTRCSRSTSADHAVLRRVQGAGDDCGREELDVPRRDDCCGSRRRPRMRMKLIRKTLAGIDPNLTVMDLRSFKTQVAGNFIEDRIMAQLDEPVWRSVAGPCLGGAVWGDVVLCSAKGRGDRNPDGAGRDAGKRDGDGDAGRCVADSGSGWRWESRGALCGKADGEHAVWRGQVRFGAMVGAPLVLVLCGIAAGFIPARRAASIEPMEALSDGVT
jgi:hypothetical protein